MSAFNTSGHVFNLKEIRFCITLSKGKQGLLLCVCWLHRLLSLFLNPRLHTNRASPLESGHILPPAVSAEETHSPTSPPLSSSFSLLPSLFPDLRQRTCDDRGVSTGHGDPLLPFCSHWPRSRYIPPCSRSPPIYSQCSQEPHSCPSRAHTVQPYRALVTLDYSGRKACVNVSLSNPSSLLPAIQISHCEFSQSVSFFTVSLCLRGRFV